MTFEELLQKVRESKNLHHVKTHYGLTFLSESYADDRTFSSGLYSTRGAALSKAPVRLLRLSALVEAIR